LFSRGDRVICNTGELANLPFVVKWVEDKENASGHPASLWPVRKGNVGGRGAL